RARRRGKSCGGRREMARHWKRCPCCWTPFVPRSEKSVGYYCSSFCAEVHGRSAPEEKCWRVCRQCREPFLAVNPHRRFCSRWCYGFKDWEKSSQDAQEHTGN